jgi:hypothetical protein
VTILAGSAAAQGNKPATPPGQAKNKAPSGGSAITSAATPGPTSIYLSSWLDDASMLERGSGWIAIAISRWGAGTASELEVPAVSGAVAIGARASVGASVPIYRYRSDPAAAAETGIGNTYLFVKLGVVDPDHQGPGFGLAVIPLLEIAGTTPGGTDGATSGGAGRVSWALPVSVEARMTHARVYGSAGYFSRGAVFGSGAVEVRPNDRWSVTATLAESYATKVDSTTADLGRSRTDLSLGASVMMGDRATIFGAVGKSLLGSSDGGAWISGGVAWRFNRR